MRQLSKWLFGLALLGMLQAPLLAQAKKDDPKISPPKVADCTQGPCLKHLDGLKLVFVVNGVGESTTLSDNLSDLNSESDTKLRIQTLSWCKQDHHFQDFVDQPSQLKAACRIAGWARLIRKDCPACEIYFIGHDAGARIVLAAAEMLPEKSVDRIILIAASVSNYYDLRPALRASRGGIDHFWSTEDDYLERVVEKRGTSEGARGHAAGRVGFRPPTWCDAAGFDAYRGLRQYRWHDDLCGQGGHYAWTIRHNLKKCVMPLFFQPLITCQIAPPPNLPPGLPLPPPSKLPPKTSTVAPTSPPVQTPVKTPVLSPSVSGVPNLPPLPAAPTPSLPVVTPPNASPPAVQSPVIAPGITLPPSRVSPPSVKMPEARD